MSRKLTYLLLIIFLVGGGGFALWKVQDQRAKAAKLESEILHGLSEEDVILLLQNQQLVDPSKTAAVVMEPESKRSFLKGLREYLSLAARARREGLADDPNIKTVLGFKTDALLNSLYTNKLDNDQGSFFKVPQDLIDAFWADPANEAQYVAEMEAIKSVQRDVAKNTGNPLAASQSTGGEAKQKEREDWAETKIVAGMAKLDQEFMGQRAIQLRIKVAEAGALSANYLNKYWADKIRVSEKEISDYLSAHPEYDLKAKKAKAQTVLDRARSGEDFAALAKEFSEDRSTKSKAGLYEDVGTGFLWREVEAVAITLDKGQIAEKLIETKDGFHIVQLVERNEAKDENGNKVVKLSVRHILLQRRFEEPGNKNPAVPPPFLTPEEIAEAETRVAKRQRFVDQIVVAEKISLPEDFAFEVTDELRNSGIRLENKLDEINAEEKEALKQRQKNK